jgi:hypothetical protein
MGMQVRSMAFGLLDSIYDAIHVFSENKLSSSPIPNNTTEVMEIEPLSKENAEFIAEGANDSNEPGPSNLSPSLPPSLSLSPTHMHAHMPTYVFVSVICTDTLCDMQLEP